jgi:hypothetical protein
MLTRRTLICALLSTTALTSVSSLVFACGAGSAGGGTSLGQALSSSNVTERARNALLAGVVVGAVVTGVTGNIGIGAIAGVAVTAVMIVAPDKVEAAANAISNFSIEDGVIFK